MELARMTVPIVGDDSHLMRTLNRVQARMTGFAGKIGGTFGSVVQGPLNDVANIVSRGLTASLIGAGAAAAYSAKKAIDLESAFVQIKKVTDFSPEQFKQLQSGLEFMATDATMAGVKLDDLLKIAEMGGKLNIGEQGVGALLDYTRALAEASVSIDDLPIEKVSEWTGQILNTFGMGAEKTRFFTSTVDKLADSTTASAAGIFDVTQRMSSMSSALGMTLPETTAIATAILDMGNRAEMSSSAVQRIMGEMARSPKPFAQLLGMTTQQFVQMRSNDPTKTLVAVTQALSKTPSSTVFQMLEELGIDGVMAQQVMMGLAARFEKLTPTIAMANHEMATGAHQQKSVEENARKTESALTLLGNSLALLADRIGQMMTPTIKALAAEFTSAAVAIKAMLDSNQGAVTGWQAAIVGAVQTVGVIWRNFGLIVEETQLRIEEKLVQAQQIIGWFVNSGASLFGWWGTVFADVFWAMWTVAKNTLTNIGELISEVWAYATSFGQDPIEFDWTALDQGLQLTATDLPHLEAFPEMISYQDKIDAVREKMFQNEQKNLDAVKAAQAGPVDPIGAALGAVGAMGGTLGAAVKTVATKKPYEQALMETAPKLKAQSAETVGLEEFHKSISKAGLGARNPAEETASGVRDLVRQNQQVAANTTELVNQGRKGQVAKFA